MTEYPFYCGGQFISSTNIQSVKNPHSQEIIARVCLADEQHIELAIAKAQELKKELAQKPSFARYEALMFIADKLKENKERLAQILAKEAGKPLRYALGEIDRSVQSFTVAAEESKRLPSEHLSLDWTAAGQGKQGLVKYFPVGIVAGISPFNFPMNLAVHKIAPAIASGNAIILKPSTSTPLSTLELAKIIHESPLPKGQVSIMPMDRKTGNLLVTDERINLLSFTGSPRVGWKMKADAGKKKVVLELGGNAGVLVSDTADIEHAVKRCLIGSFAYSGQVCIHAQRIYVHKKVYHEFLEKFSNATRKLRLGPPEDPQTEVSSMIDENNAIRVEDWVKEAVAEGAQVVCGGKRDKNLYWPTILTGTKQQMKVCALEVFGPVVSVEKVEKFESGIQLINESNYGLQAAVFTKHISEMDYAHQNLEVGGVIINDVTTFRVDHMPYGGVKNSGLGREGIKYAIHDMMEARILVR